jgi:hypothetical protein
VVLRVPADLLVEDLHVPEARVKVHLETANAVQVSPNTAIVLPDRVPVARAARELARAATAMPRVGPANVVSASHTVSAVSANLTVNAANASPTVSVRVVHQVRVLVARAARELVHVATVMLRVGPANVVSASHTVNAVSAVSANLTVSVRVVLQVRVLVVRVLAVRAARELVRAARELARVATVMLRVGLANVVSASHTVNVASASHTVNAVNANPTVSVRVVLQVRVLVVRVLAVRAAREMARAAREQARAAKIVVVRFAKSLSSGR